MVIHSYAPYYYINNKGNFINLKSKEDLSIKFMPQTKGNIEYYFLSSFFNFVLKKKIFIIII